MLITLTTLSDSLAAFKDFTGDGDVQIQTIQPRLLGGGDSNGERVHACCHSMRGREQVCRSPGARPTTCPEADPGRSADGTAVVAAGAVVPARRLTGHRRRPVQHGVRGSDPHRSVLVMVDPAARLLEVVTGSEARRELEDQEVRLVAVK